MSQTDNESPNPNREEETCPQCGYAGPAASIEQHKCEAANTEVTKFKLGIPRPNLAV